uniref:Uncharacterized protein n=1 Tax=Caenorhabditis japonica TaxID=281687 RepID=A0A8R1EP18_CAEJA
MNKKEDVPKSNEEIRKEVSVKVGPPVPEPASTAVPASDSSQMKSKLVLAKNPAAKGRGDKPKSTGCCSIL